MKILAIESSGMTASVAIATEEKIIAQYTINYKLTHSQTLLPMIDEIVKFTNQDIKEIDYFAVSAGPGSFTGLRIGSATAKGMALALDKEIVTVPTLEAMAYNFMNYDGVICPMLDARRDRVFAGIYKFTDGKLQKIYNQDVDTVDEIIARINECNTKAILLGDGSHVYKEKLQEKLNIEFTIASAHMAFQSAASVAVLAMEMIENGKAESGDKHKPIYLRPSQAEMEKIIK